MLIHAISIDQDIIWIDDDPIVKQISKDIVYEMLKGSKSISQIKRHYQSLKETIVSLKGDLPFVAFSDLDQVIAVSEINFDEDACLCQ